MIPREIIDSVRRIEITTRRLVTDIFAGQYHSVFKGRGIEFDEVREYQPGDDVRAIDWNVTARTGVPHIKKFVEEREMTVMVLVDASLSTRFSSRRKLKSRLAAEIAAVLAFSAIRNHDKIGLMFFTDTVEKFIPPRKGRGHVLRLIREILMFHPSGRGTDIGAAVERLTRVISRRAVVFVLSDFWEPGVLSGEARFMRPLAAANRRHDVIAVSLDDPREHDLPDCGLIELEDAEEGGRVLVDSGSPAVRRLWREQAAARREGRARMFRGMDMDHISIATDDAYADRFVQFFRMRQRRAR